jgi:stringent starvation protein B
MINAQDIPSSRPYLIRAMYEWCTDSGYTPYVAVQVDDTVQVPQEFVKNGEIVLNVSYDATSSLKLGNEWIEFKARFGGKAREIMVPVSRVIAIYARENGQGMAFPAPGPAVRGPVDAPAARGLASVAPAEQRAEQRVEQKVVQLVPQHEPDTAAGSPESGNDGDEPPRTPPGGKRPALTRVK